MKKILLIFSLFLAIGLVGCNKNTTIVCEGVDGVFEFTWNDDDGFIEARKNGVLESDEYINELNLLIEESDYQTVAEYMENFIYLGEIAGYECN